MKIRTDFVTNSSSSSFITVIMVDENGKIQEDKGEYENFFEASEEIDFEDLFNAMNSPEDLFNIIDTYYYGNRSSYDDVIKTLRVPNQKNRRAVLVMNHDWGDEWNPKEPMIYTVYDYDYFSQKLVINEYESKSENDDSIYHRIKKQIQSDLRITDIHIDENKDVLKKLNEFGFGEYVKGDLKETLKNIDKSGNLFKNSKDLDNYLAFLNGENHKKLPINQRYVFYSFIAVGNKQEIDKDLKAIEKNLGMKIGLKEGERNNSFIFPRHKKPQSYLSYIKIFKAIAKYRMVVLAKDIELNQFVLLLSEEFSNKFRTVHILNDSVCAFENNILELQIFETEFGRKLLYSKLFDETITTELTIVKMDNSTIKIRMPYIRFSNGYRSGPNDEQRYLFVNNESFNVILFEEILKNQIIQEIPSGYNKEEPTEIQFFFSEYRDNKTNDLLETAVYSTKTQDRKYLPIPTIEQLKGKNIYVQKNKVYEQRIKTVLEKNNISYLQNLKSADHLDYYIAVTCGVENAIYERIAHGENIIILQMSDIEK